MSCNSTIRVQSVEILSARIRTPLFFVLFFSNIQEMRNLHKDAFLKKHNVKLGFMSAFVKAAAQALTDQPAVNAGKMTFSSCSICFFSPLF